MIKLFIFLKKKRLPGEVLDEVQEVAGCDGHDVAAALDDLVVALVQRLVDVHHRVHDSLSVHGGNIFTKKKK